MIKTPSIKMFYIQQNIFPTREFIDLSIIKAFLKNNIVVRSFDFKINYRSFIADFVSRFGNKHDQRTISVLAYTTVSRLIVQEAVDFKPDIIFVVNGDLIHHRYFIELKNLGFKIANWNVDDPYNFDLTKRNMLSSHLIFTVDSSTIDRYKETEHKYVYHLPLGYSQDVFFKKEVSDEYKNDICFIGTPFKSSFRIRVINELAVFLQDYKVKIIGSHVPGESWHRSLTNFDLLEKFIREDYVDPVIAANYYNGSKINLNIHRDDCDKGPSNTNKENIIARSPNERMFNIAGCCAFQIADNSRPDTSKYLLPDKEIVIFESIDDLKKKIIYYLRNDKERSAIAMRSHKRALKDHALDKRIDFILEKINLFMQEQCVYNMK